MTKLGRQIRSTVSKNNILQSLNYRGGFAPPTSRCRDFFYQRTFFRKLAMIKIKKGMSDSFDKENVISRLSKAKKRRMFTIKLLILISMFNLIILIKALYPMTIIGYFIGV